MRESRRGRLMEGDEPNWGVTDVYMEMLQRNSLCNYHILIKTFLKLKLPLRELSAH
jgi:hypothetical protein